jgi:PST family polysaccharide transporter
MILLIVYWGLKGALIAAALGASLPGLIMLISSLNSPWLKFRLWFGGTSRVARKAVAGYILMAVASVIFGPASLILVRNILVDSAGWEVAGHWQSVFRISEVYLSVLTVALGTYVLPKLSSLKDNQSIKHEVKSTLIVVAPLSILLAILIYLFRDLIITLLFTDEFRDARDLFSIQLAGDVLKICSWVIAFPLVSKGLAKIFIITEVLTNSMFVVLAYYFVDGFGVQGANIAYFLTYFIYFISMSFLMKKVLV